jgi:hypothetical protein
MPIRVEGVERLVAKLDRITPSVYDELGDELDSIGSDLKAKSVSVAPFREGDLRESAYHNLHASYPDLEMTVGYDGPPDYLLVQHEGGWENFMGEYGPKRIENYTTPGTGPKFLENPWTQNKAQYKRRSQQAARRGLRNA